MTENEENTMPDASTSGETTIDNSAAPGCEDTPGEEPPRKSRWARFKASGHPFLVVAVAVAVVAALSAVPWAELTGNFLKDYDLLADVKTQTETQTVNEASTGDDIDPELQEELNREQQETSETEAPGNADTKTAMADNPDLEPAERRDVPDIDPVVEGKVMLEDYTPDGSGLKNFHRAVTRRDEHPARIAVLGDSYIEGDIMTQDLRSMLQTAYGGRGVGYVPAHSQVSGFRTSIRQNSSGWTQQAVNKTSRTNLMPLAGEYFTGGPGSKITLKGVPKDPKLAGWSVTKLMFIAPTDGTVTITAAGEPHTFSVEASERVQALEVEAETSAVEITTTIPGLKVFGAWVEDARGVTVDNMSIRGYSGISHRQMNQDLASQMREHVDYDLIIVEYGINALSATQSDYSRYGNMLVQMLQRLRQCYPSADIVLMGIGDRGQKVNGQPHSLPTVPNMIAAQRQAAKSAGVLFWDTRVAMGGEDAIVDWRERRLANGDYIHLNAKGGKELAKFLFEAINENM